MTRHVRISQGRRRTPPSVLVGALLWFLMLGACRTTAPRPDPVETDDGSILVLREQTFSELTIPGQNRPENARPGERLPIDGPWRYAGSTRAGMYKYQTKAPVRPRGLFFYQAPGGMRMFSPDGTELVYDRFGDHDRPIWSLDREHIFVYMPERTPPSGTFHLSYDKALEREEALNFDFQSRTVEREVFVWQSIQDDWDHRRGLLLPAPGVAAWAITVPDAGELQFLSGLAEPEVLDGPPSDGARLKVELEVDGKVHAVGDFELAVRAFTPRRIDLSAWAGKSATLRFRTEPGKTATFDYAFIAEPVVASRLENPVRVVMVFIDTLRPDHMSLYGYHRDTTKAIDGLAKTSAVFWNTRSVAPWTLPSARTMVTGRHPEHYLADDTQTLPAILGDMGFATAFIAGNVYLSVNFEMHRDWNLHRVGLWPSAKEVTDDTLEWLDEHEGRHSLIQVHYMDAHLPYLEPKPFYRTMYAGLGPAGLRDEFHLSDVRKARLGNDPAGQQYVQDRYDNNIRYATDQIARIVERLDDNDVLLLYSDHGEEFWEHGNFEHGHSLFDELLKIPLVIRAPGVKPGRIDAPTSLLDLTPTILDLLGKAIPENAQGTSLVAVTRGEAGAAKALAERDQAFGRPLYGMERWGVLHGDEKWSTREGREALYDLAKDPGEQNNLLREPDGDEGKPYRGYLATALGREVAAGYRLTPTRARPKNGEGVTPLWALCTVEGGLKAAWSGTDPLKFGSAAVQPVGTRKAVEDRLETYQIYGHDLPTDLGQAYEICWSGKPGTREIYLVPEKPLEEVGATFRCSAYAGDEKGGRRTTLAVPRRRATPGKVRTPLTRATFPQRQLFLQFGISPLPSEGVVEIDATDDEMSSALTAMGYAQDDYAGAIGGCVPAKTKLPVPEKFQAKQDRSD